jgi:7-carboxy-7-deazaguanine synthase
MQKVNLVNNGIFYTIQGEGFYIGTPSVFIRFSGCNLRCKWFLQGKEYICDTPYSSFNPEKNLKTIEEVLKEVEKFEKFNFYHVVITGGEPFLQKDALKELCNKLKEKNKFITIETNGTIFYEVTADFISLSPKLKSSNNEKKTIDIDTLNKFIDYYNFLQFKFVVNELSDINEINSIVLQLNKKDNYKIYLMPQGYNGRILNKNLKKCFELVKKNTNYLVTDRFHIRAYGNKKGV